MSKQVLHFLNEQEFQNFTSQLFSEAFPSFQAIEGAGGDGGLDGIDGETAYQMFFPEPKNRIKAKYVAKIDDSLAKLQKTIKDKELAINQWVFVVPEDLNYEVVLHIQKQGQMAGIECLYWGATKLTALLSKYPNIRDSFPEVFLPDVKKDLIDVKSGIIQLGRKSSYDGVEIVTDEEYENERAAIRAEQKQLINNASIRFSGSSASILATQAINNEAKKKFDALETRKKASDRFYELEQQEIADSFEQERQQKLGELAGRGLANSGFTAQADADIQKRRKREMEKLALKYGKKEVAGN